MKRVHQENAETYEVTGTEVALALGLYLEEGDTITLTKVAGDTYKLKVAGHYDEDEEIPIPVALSPGLLLAAYGTVEVDEPDTLRPVVMIPPDLGDGVEAEIV